MENNQLLLHKSESYFLLQSSIQIKLDRAARWLDAFNQLESGEITLEEFDNKISTYLVYPIIGM